MLIPISFGMGLALGLALKSLITYHRSDRKAAEQIRLRIAAEAEAAAYQQKVKRLASELTMAEEEIASLRRQLGLNGGAS
jgi:hypothetical protein